MSWHLPSKTPPLNENVSVLRKSRSFPRPSPAYKSLPPCTNFSKEREKFSPLPHPSIHPSSAPRLSTKNILVSITWVINAMDLCPHLTGLFRTIHRSCSFLNLLFSKFSSYFPHHSMLPLWYHHCPPHLLGTSSSGLGLWLSSYTKRSHTPPHVPTKYSSLPVSLNSSRESPSTQPLKLKSQDTSRMSSLLSNQQPNSSGFTKAFQSCLRLLQLCILRTQAQVFLFQSCNQSEVTSEAVRHCCRSCGYRSKWNDTYAVTGLVLPWMTVVSGTSWVRLPTRCTHGLVNPHKSSLGCSSNNNHIIPALKMRDQIHSHSSIYP